MPQTLHVGNVADTVTDQQLHDLFAPSGAVLDAHVMTDRTTGACRGFALVEMATPEASEEAVRALNGTRLGGQALSVRPAITRAPGWARGNDQGGNNRSHGFGVGNGGSRY
jgi:RNA recognition motif-containing protein